jgi:hypothetical protein
MPRKGRYSIDTDNLQLQVGEWKGTSSLQLSRLRACQGRDANEKVSDSTPRLQRAVLFQPHHPKIIRGGATQQPQPPSVAQACPVIVEERIAPPFFETQPTTRQSVQAPNANSSSLNDMYAAIATIFQQIMTQLNGAESQEDRIMATTKTVLKLMKQNGRYS